MAKRKLQRFAEIENFENVFQHLQNSEYLGDFKLKGKWNEEYFKNKNPIVLELGCGKGEYTVGLAERFPDKNFIGIDIKGARLWRGSKTALENKIQNVAFVRTRIDHIERIFCNNEISEIWITFPDPQLQESKTRKRLTAPVFLDRYKNILTPNGIIHLKTDNAAFYGYTLAVITENGCQLIESTHDLYGDKKYSVDLDVGAEGLLSIKTFYEKKFTEKGFKICYLKFRMMGYKNPLRHKEQIVALNI